MNKRVLFSAVLAATIGAGEVQAQKVTAPSLPTPTELKLDGTDTVYVYNVKANKWLINGNAYNTQTSLDSVGMQVAFVPNKKSETFTLVNNSSGSFGRKIFANDLTTDGGNSYVDYNNQGAEKCNWFVHKDGVNFQLQADSTSLSDATGTRAGWNPNDPNLDGQGNAATSGIFRPALKLSDEGASEYGITWQAFAREDAQKYFLRVQMMPAINAAIEEGYDVSKSVTVYNNANATLAELQAALQYISDVKRNKALEGASADNPVDITEYMKNADCDATTGWTLDCVYDADGNVGSGGHGTNWQAHSATYSTADGSFTTSKFIERWINSGSNPDTGNEAGTGHLSDGSLSQKLTNLPAGGYKLSCYAMACNQAKSDLKVDGISLYAKQGDKVSSVKVATVPQVPEKFEFLLSVEEGQDLEVGFKIDNTNANWIFVDEFNLTYYGSDAKVMNLMDMQSTATDLEDFMSGNEAFCPTYLDEASDLIEEAKAMQTTASNEEIAKMKTKLLAIKASIEESLAKYVSLGELIDECNDFLGSGDVELTDEFNSLYYEGGDFGDEGAEELYGNYTLDNETLDKYMAALKEALAESRKNSIAAGSDVTWKLTNPSFDNGSTGWTGSKTVDSNYKNCESYQGTFDMYQVLEDLPEGVYELSAQAMSRMTWNADTYTAHENGSEVITAELYANDLSSKFASPFDAYTTQKYDNEYEYSVGAETRYAPNSMKGFQGSCDENENNYLIKVKVYVEKGNSLRVGVRETTRPSSSGDWCIWDNFKLKYVGNDAAALQFVADPVLEKAKGLYDSKMSADSLSALQAAAKELDENVTSANIKALSAAITAAQTSIAAYQPLSTAIENVKSRYDTNESTAKTSDEAKAIYNAALTAAENGYNNGTIADAAISSEVDKLNGAFTQYLVNDIIKDASESNPVDVSKAIVNNDFATMDGTGWTAVTGSAGFQAANAVEAAEFYNQAFNYQQKVVGLPQGTYYLKSKAFYRNGNSTSATIDADSETLKYEVNNNAFLYYSDNADITAEGAKVDSVALKPISAAVVSEGNLEDYVAMGSTSGLVAYGDGYIPNTMATAQSFFNSKQVGDNYVTDGLKIVYNGKGNFYVGAFKKVLENADWTIISNFTLEYLGITEDTGVNNLVSDADAVSTKIYTVNGMQVSKLQKGINIIETVMKDGSKKVKKVILK